MKGILLSLIIKDNHIIYHGVIFNSLSNNRFNQHSNLSIRIGLPQQADCARCQYYITDINQCIH